MAKKKRAFSYIRMSTEAQLKGHSLERQTELARQYAEENGLELVESLQDIGLSAHSGANVQRGELGRFLEALENGEIEKDCVLLVENLDRLSRQNPTKAFTQFSRILEYGIEIHTIFDKQIYTQETINNNPGLLFSSIGYMLRAYSESEDKSKRLRKKWENKRNNLDKKILTSVCPAWLKPNEDRTGFVVIDENAKTVRKIFDLCIDENMGANSITRWLNEHIEEYPKFDAITKNVSKVRHSGWQQSYIKKIMNNPAVHGEYQPHTLIDGKRVPVGEVIPNYFPAVISKDRFLLAQARVAERKIKGGGRKGEQFSNIFTKLLRCGKCKSSVVFRNKGKPPKGGKYLICYSSARKSGCNCPAWRYDDFEESFFKWVVEVPFEDILVSGNQKTRRAKLEEQQSVLHEKIKRKNKQLDSLLDITESLSESAKNRLIDKIGKISEELNRLEDELESMKREILDIDSRKNYNHSEIVQAIKDLQSSVTNEERTVIRRRINKQISLVVDRIIIFNAPKIIYPWDVVDMLSPHVKRALKRKGIEEQSDIERLFSGAYPERLFNEMERYYVVHFKNGATRRVQPYVEQSWYRENLNREFARFIERMKKRESDREYRERKRLAK